MHPSHVQMYNTSDTRVKAQMINNAIKDIDEKQKS